MEEEKKVTDQEDVKVTIPPEKLEDKERDEVYGRYEKFRDGGKEEKPPEKSPEPKEEVKPKEEDKIKYVPYDALHEEREKRKAATQKVKDLEQQVKTLLSDYKTVIESNRPKEEEPVIDDYTKELVDLKKKVVFLEKELDGTKKETSEDRKRRSEEGKKKQEAEVSVKIKTVADELEKEGFPLFEEMAYRVSEEIVKEINEADADDAEKLFKDLDRPVGWKKIYKEKIYPAISTKLGLKIKEQSIKDKEEAKKKAKLTDGGGSPPQEADEDKEWTYADYLQFRKETSAGASKPKRR